MFTYTHIAPNNSPRTISLKERQTLATLFVHNNKTVELHFRLSGDKIQTSGTTDLPCVWRDTTEEFLIDALQKAFIIEVSEWMSRFCFFAGIQNPDWSSTPVLDLPEKDIRSYNQVVEGFWTPQN